MCLAIDVNLWCRAYGEFWAHTCIHKVRAAEHCFWRHWNFCHVMGPRFMRTAMIWESGMEGDLRQAIVGMLVNDYMTVHVDIYHVLMLLSWNHCHIFLYQIWDAMEVFHLCSHHILVNVHSAGWLDLAVDRRRHVWQQLIFVCRYRVTTARRKARRRSVWASTTWSRSGPTAEVAWTPTRSNSASSSRNKRYVRSTLRCCSFMTYVIKRQRQVSLNTCVNGLHTCRICCQPCIP